jgi:hypothetical protein
VSDSFVLEYPKFRPSVIGHAIGKINDPHVTSKRLYKACGSPSDLEAFLAAFLGNILQERRSKELT